MKYILLMLISSLAFSQSYEIKYEVIYKSKFSPFALEKFKEEDNKKNTSRQDWINKTENPKPAYYLTKFNKELSLTEYQSSINNDQDSNLEVNIKPFGSGEIYKFSNRDSINTFVSYKELGDNVFSSKKNILLNWVDNKKDSIILSYKVHLLESETPEIKYRIWYTKELPSGVGISDIKINNGFILYYEAIKKPSKVFDYEIIKAYPLYIKNKKNINFLKGINFKNWKLYDDNKIKEMYKNLNEKNN